MASLSFGLSSSGDVILLASPGTLVSSFIFGELVMRILLCDDGEAMISSCVTIGVGVVCSSVIDFIMLVC